MTVLHIERIGGGVVGAPGPRMQSSGEQPLSALSPADQAAVEALFKAPQAKGGAHGNVPRYRITRQDSGQSVEVPETAVPAALVGCVKDKLL